MVLYFAEALVAGSNVGIYLTACMSAPGKYTRSYALHQCGQSKGPTFERASPLLGVACAGHKSVWREKKLRRSFPTSRDQP